MKIYNYDKKTKEYLFASEAEADPEETRKQGRFIALIPANATLKEVPIYDENEIPVYSSHIEQQIITEKIPVYDEETGEITSYAEQEKTINILVEKWTVTKDYRKNFYKVDDNFNVEKITTIGEQLGFYIIDRLIGEDIKANPDYYKIVEGKILKKTSKEYEQEQQKKEAERVAKLSLTRGDVLRGLLLAKGVTKDQIAQMIETMPATTQEEVVAKELAKIDFEDALNFYRGVPLIDTIGTALGITKEQLDKFFETNDYTKLINEEDEQ